MNKFEYITILLNINLHFNLNFAFQLPEKLYKNLSHSTRMLRYTVPLPMLAYPLYLVNPNS